MRAELVALFGLVATAFCAPRNDDNLDRILELLPRQSNVTCPHTPSPMPNVAALPAIKTKPDPFLYLDSKTRVQSKAEWIQCCQPEVMRLLQEYQYGYYPDHSQETVSVTRNGTTLIVTIAAGGKNATIVATLTFPSGSGPFPVIISIGGMDTETYLHAGIAIATFDYSKVAADSNTKSDSFWTLYNGKDIGILRFLLRYCICTNNDS